MLSTTRITIASLVLTGLVLAPALTHAHTTATAHAQAGSAHAFSAATTGTPQATAHAEAKTSTESNSAHAQATAKTHSTKAHSASRSHQSTKTHTHTVSHVTQNQAEEATHAPSSQTTSTDTHTQADETSAMANVPSLVLPAAVAQAAEESPAQSTLSTKTVERFGNLMLMILLTLLLNTIVLFILLYQTLKTPRLPVQRF